LPIHRFEMRTQIESPAADRKCPWHRDKVTLKFFFQDQIAFSYAGFRNF
jgi:hypothetical protein